MKNPSFRSPRQGFTLMETVIAIGVLAVLLTAFLAVFAPAAQGIRKAISVQEADRLAYTLERELVTLRSGDGDEYGTGFEKAYDWIIDSDNADRALLIYQYRGDPNQIRTDGTMEPYTGTGVAGQDFVVQPVVRTKDSSLLEEDLRAIEGRVYTAQLTQLVFNGGELVKGDPGKIVDPTPDDGDAAGGTGVDSYPEAVIAFAAEFYVVPNASYKFISTKMNDATFNDAKPVFTRNLAVRR